jgi:hypothetical protein
LDAESNRQICLVHPAWPRKVPWSLGRFFNFNKSEEEDVNTRRVLCIEYLGSNIVAFVDECNTLYVKNLESGNVLMRHQLNSNEIPPEFYYKIQSLEFSPFAQNTDTDIYAVIAVGITAGKLQYMRDSRNENLSNSIRIFELNLVNPANHYVPNFLDISNHSKETFMDKSCMKNYKIREIHFDDCKLLEFRLTPQRLYVSLFDEILVKNRIDVYKMENNEGLFKEVTQCYDDTLVQDLLTDYSMFKGKPITLTQGFMVDRIMKQGRFNFNTIREVLENELEIIANGG